VAQRIFTATVADAETIARIVSAANRDVASKFGLDADKVKDMACAVGKA